MLGVFGTVRAVALFRVEHHTLTDAPGILIVMHLLRIKYQ